MIRFHLRAKKKSGVKKQNKHLFFYIIIVLKHFILSACLALASEESIKRRQFSLNLSAQNPFSRKKVKKRRGPLLLRLNKNMLDIQHIFIRPVRYRLKKCLDNIFAAKAPP